MEINNEGFSLAICSLAIEEKKVNIFKKQISDLLIAFNENKKIIQIIDSREIQIEKKFLIIDELKIDILLKNFLKLLIKKNKFKKTIYILEKTIKLLNKELNIIEGILYTNYEVSKELLTKMEEKVSKKLNLKILLINKIDLGIKAGFIIKVNDFIIEDTIENRIIQIKQKLLKGEI